MTMASVASARRIAYRCSIFAMALASLVLAGWILDVHALKSILPTYITMKANTAVGIGLLAYCVFLCNQTEWHRRRAWTVRALALMVFSIGVLTLAQYIFHVNLGIDELLFRDPAGVSGKFPPGRLAPVTAVCLILLSLSLVENSRARVRFAKWSQFSTLIACLIAFQALIGYLSGVTYSFGSAFYTQMAVHTAVGFIAVGVAMLFTWSERGFMPVLTAPSAGGHMARRLIVAAIVVPPLVNWLQFQGQRLGWYDADFGVLIRVVGDVIFFFALVLQSATWMHGVDEKRGENELAVKTRSLELERALEELGQRGAHLRLVMNAIPSLIAYVDRHFQLSFVNSAFEHFTLQSAASLVGQKVDSASSLDFMQSLRAQIERSLAGEKISCETRAVDTAGAARELRVTLIPDLDSNAQVRGVVVVLDDVTERNRAETDRVRLTASEQSARETARLKSEFLANMSHEVRTPINGVIGMAGLLESTPLTEEQTTYVGAIQRSGDILLTLVNDILDLSKIEAGKLDFELIDFSPRQAVEDVSRALAHAASAKGLNMRSEISPNLPEFLKGDPGRLQQVMMNLLNNAIKFTARGEVCIRAHSPWSDEHGVVLRVEVSDTGIGIPTLAMERMFEAFSQADSSTQRRFGGTGLGLSICKKLVKHMNGQIGVNSRTDAGSTFWFEVTLPTGARPAVQTAADAPAPTAETPRLRPDGKTFRILLAEDNQINQLVATRTLQAMGYYVDVAANGNEVLDALRAAPYDLIFMDCQMPELDGYETTRLIRKSATLPRDILIVAMTANAMKGDAEKCLASGMDGYVSKPVARGKLNEVLTQFLGSARKMGRVG